MKQICIWGGLILSLALLSPAMAQKTTQKPAATKSSTTQKSATTAKNATATAQKSTAQKEGVLPFKGTIEYKVEYKTGEIPMMPTEAKPSTATVQISDTKLLMDAGPIKSILNADEKRSYNLLNYTAMGIGKYVLAITEDELRHIPGITNYVFNTTNETKTILGYKAQKSVGSFTTPQASLSFEVWCVDKFCHPFFNLVKNMFVGIESFPLEYTMTMRTPQGYEETVIFTVSKMNYGNLDAQLFMIPRDYKRVTEAELQKIMEDFMSSNMKLK